LDQSIDRYLGIVHHVRFLTLTAVIKPEAQRRSHGNRSFCGSTRFLHGGLLSCSIVKAHRGRLWAARNDGPGSTFLFLVIPGFKSTAHRDKRASSFALQRFRNWCRPRPLTSSRFLPRKTTPRESLSGHGNCETVLRQNQYQGTIQLLA
jgi:hypothetical protein